MRHVWCQGSLLARSTTRGTMEVRDLEPLSRVLQVGETRRTQVSLSSIECCFVCFFAFHILPLNKEWLIPQTLDTAPMMVAMSM